MHSLKSLEPFHHETSSASPAASADLSSLTQGGAPLQDGLHLMARLGSSFTSAKGFSLRLSTC